MNPQKEFLRHANECEQMARLTRDPESRITWNRMANVGANAHQKQSARARRLANKYRGSGIAGTLHQAGVRCEPWISARGV